MRIFSGHGRSPATSLAVTLLVATAMVATLLVGVTAAAPPAAAATQRVTVDIRMRGQVLATGLTVAAGGQLEVTVGQVPAPCLALDGFSQTVPITVGGTYLPPGVNFGSTTTRTLSVGGGVTLGPVNGFVGDGPTRDQCIAATTTVTLTYTPPPPPGSQRVTVDIRMRGQVLATGLTVAAGGQLEVTVGQVPAPCLALDGFSQTVPITVGGTYLPPGVNFGSTTTRTLSVGGGVTLGPVNGFVGDGPTRDQCIAATTTVTLTYTPPPPPGSQRVTVDIRMRGQVLATGLTVAAGGQLEVTVGQVPAPCLALDGFSQTVPITVGGTYLPPGVNFGSTTTRTLSVGGGVTLGPVNGFVGDGPTRDQCIAATTTVTLTYTPPPPAATSTALTSSANPSLAGQAVTYTATVTPAPDGGTVQFADGGTPITGCTAQPVDTATGTATCETTYTAAGSHPITATYSGSPVFAASSGTLTQTVDKIATSTSLTSSANPSLAGQAVTYTATVGPVPDTGTVEFSDGGTPITGCTMQPVDTAIGTATCETTYAGAGSHPITVTYSGSPAFAASSGTLTQTVDKIATTTTLVVPATPRQVHKRLTFTATIRPTPDGGTVRFTDNGAQLAGCAAVEVSGGTAACTVTLRTTGRHTVKAAYSGTEAFGASSATRVIKVVPDPCPAQIGKVISSSCLEYNLTQFRYLRTQLGANPYSYPALKKRLGSERAADRRTAKYVQTITLYETHSLNGRPVPQFVRLIGIPSYKVRQATSKTLRAHTYSVYEIFGETSGPVVTRAVWRYGLTGTNPWTARPASQLRSCLAYFERVAPGDYSACDFRRRVKIVGWYNAHLYKAGFTMEYARHHEGRCPPGMPLCK